MQIYYAPNTIALASLITCEEAGVTVEPIRVDFASGEQTKPAFAKVNPKGRVPALITDHGILTETIAILEYIAPHLIPQDPWDAARMREMMTYLASTMHVNHAHKMRGHRWADKAESHADMTAKVPETMTASCAYVESKIAGPLVMGDTLTLADPYLFTVCTWLEGDGVDVSAFPKLTAFIAAMNARPSVQKAKSEGWFT
ncbi:glutathione S-transferase family protein [Shimia ponticola]|uniref:glutathione S-transferase family protein n=1 Tax=Shimia ponticola TaxID=2582893 RepID=UPI0011BF5BFD|nr:glutathione S-transferase family protein [Shimia ponticola]